MSEEFRSFRCVHFHPYYAAFTIRMGYSAAGLTGVGCDDESVDLMAQACFRSAHLGRGPIAHKDLKIPESFNTLKRIHNSSFFRNRP